MDAASDTDTLPDLDTPTHLAAYFSMMKPLNALPGNYSHHRTLDLRNDRRMLVLMNLTAIVLLLPAGFFFWRALIWLRPNQAGSGLAFRAGSSDAVFTLLVVLISSVLMLILHEGIHGIFFWIFTRSKPVFALKSLYAYAAAPEWYLPRNQYLIVSLSPLLLISLLCILLLAFVPVWLFLPVLCMAVFNAAGSTGDLFIAVWLLFQPATCLANDRGDIFSLYLPN